VDDLWTLTSLGIVVVGLLAGVLSGMFGVGGAVLTTPGVRVLGASEIAAVGSTIPAILPGAISGTARYAREGLVNWRVGLVCGGAGMVFAFGGAWVSDLVDAGWLMVATAVLLGISGYRILMSGREARRLMVATTGDDGPTEPAGTMTVPSQASATVLTTVGAGAGFLAGLLGVGGGVVMMPVFTSVLRIPLKEAVASSLVAVAIFSIPAMLTHWYLGHIDWHFAVLLVIGVVPGARIGSRITVGSSDSTVRVMLGTFFIVLAFVYGGRELLNLI
jgi:hypothetical protein